MPTKEAQLDAEKFNLLLEADRAIAKITVDGALDWCKKEQPEIYKKLWSLDDEIDTKWNEMYLPKLREILLEKYNKFKYVINLYQRRIKK